MADTKSFLKRCATGEMVPVTDNMIAGRVAECDVVLTEGHPSRRHARFVVIDDEVSLEDLGSANGTFVNDQRIESAVTLRTGDVIRFDIEKFEFTAPDATVKQAGDKTVVRPPDSLDVDGGGARQRPAWIDPGSQGTGGPKTEFIDASAMRDMMQAQGQDGANVPDTISTPMILITSGAKSGLRINLTGDEDRAEWTIGCDSDRDIVIDDQGVSGIHAKLAREGARWKLSDQMSANGTYVNGKRSNMSYLDDQDRIRFGPVECIFRTPASFGRATRVTRGIQVAPKRSNVLLIVVGFAVTLAALYMVVRFMF